jgi:predicted patatin/cPLA2 family phospholipase
MPLSDSMVYDCLVLSGGGAKGAYGAGAAKALWEYRRLKKVERPLCFFGASAGALNAAVLATDGADALIRLWRSMTNRTVLGVHIKSAKFQGAKSWLRGLFKHGQPFYIYSSATLLALIRRQTSFSRLRDSHLVVAATNYTEGSLKAFYYSSIFDLAVAEDKKRPESQQRLAHLQSLTDQNFHSCLLASASIPVFFPPVQIDGSLYIDGGVGNNTPTREAAYFLRYLESEGKGKAGEMFCVMLEPPGLRQEGSFEYSLLGIVDRTLSIYHNVHTKPIIHAWFRINEEVKTYDERLHAFIAWVEAQGWDNALVQNVRREVEARLGGLGGSARRLDVPMRIVEPSTPLGETLDFDRSTIEGSIKAGYRDMLKALSAAEKIDQAELTKLQNAPIFVGG